MPADALYGAAQAVGRACFQKGIIGFVGVDFVVSSGLAAETGTGGLSAVRPIDAEQQHIAEYVNCFGNNISKSMPFMLECHYKYYYAHEKFISMNIYDGVKLTRFNLCSHCVPLVFLSETQTRRFASMRWI